jgi:type IX secretion system PorP/SprF family membrane protein
MYKKLLYLFILMIAGLQAIAQDPQFTQFYANPLYLNPAFAGSAHCPRLSLNYRNQWPALQGTFVTSSFSYDQQIASISSGVGLMALADNAGEGTLNTTRFSGFYSYQLNVTREFSLRFGFEGTYQQRKIDWDKLTFGDMIDPRYGFIYPTTEIRPNTNKSFVDFSAGVLAYSSNIYGGLAFDHLTQPEESFIKPAPGSTLPMKITAHVGAIIPLESRYSSEGTYLSPNILYQKQRDFQQINIGLYAGKAPLVGGLWYRHSGSNPDAVEVLVGLQQGIFKLGYSYDVTVSKLANVSAGSHEVSLGLQFPCRPKKKRFRTIRCPSF